MSKLAAVLGISGMLSCLIPARAEPIWLERYEEPVPSGLSNPMQGPGPSGWETGNLVRGLRDYALFKEPDGNTFLRASFIPGTKGKPIYKKVDWNIRTHPYLHWRWRVNAWARGARVADPKKEDSTASVYVSVRSGLKPYVIKYIWAEEDLVGSGYQRGEWNPAGALRAIVIRKGGSLGEWANEKRNVAEDFKAIYKREIPSWKGRGIGVLTEGDSTGTEPKADYDDFYVSID